MFLHHLAVFFPQFYFLSFISPCPPLVGESKENDVAMHADVCWRTRAKREGAVAVGDVPAGRVRRAFEDAGDGRGIERGGGTNGSAREGELAD